MDTDGQGIPAEQEGKGTDVPPAVSTPAEDEALPLGLIPGCLTVDQAAAKAGVTTKTIRRWLESGALPSIMVRRGKARILQIKSSDLEEAVKASGRRKVRAAPLPLVLEETKLALQESRLRHEAELAEIRTALALEQKMRQEERERLSIEAQSLREEAAWRMVEDEARRQSQAEELRTVLAEVRQALSESKAEAHELKAQVSMLQDQVLRALPAPPESIWQKIGKAFGIGRK